VRLELLPSRRGYALLPFPGADVPTCEQRVELLAPAGNACGGVTYPIRSGACRTEALELGWDGTVLQRLPATAPDRCGYQWWPRSLR
jgi:hypothetical protein